MKVALKVPSWPAEYASNGIVTYASHLVPALRGLGHTVFVLTSNKAPDHDDPYTIDLNRYEFAPTPWDRVLTKFSPAQSGFKAASVPIAAAVKDLIQTHGLDVFEMEESGGWSYAVSELNVIPVIVRLHGPWFLTGKFNDPGNEIALFKRRDHVEGRGIRHAHLVTANCEETLRSVKEHYGLELKGSRIIRTPIEAVDATEVWNVRTWADKSLLFVGRFDKLKGGDIVLRAFAELAKTDEKVRLTFVGPDRGIKDAHGKVLHFRDFVERFVPETIRGRIDFHGQMNHADLMALRTKRFVTLAAAQYDTMGYMILEAMSLGCPLISTAVGGIPEFVKDLGNGLLVPSQDVDAMVAACRKLLRDPELAKRLGRQAWEDCRDLYSPDNIARQTVAAYAEAADRFKFGNRHR